MISRPVATALGCRQCQSAIFRAILSRPAGNGICSPPGAKRATAQLPILTRRLFSQERKLQKAREKTPEKMTSQDAGEAQAETAASSQPTTEQLDGTISGDQVPWFLEVEPPRHPPSQHTVTLPKIPDDAPEFLEPMMKYIYEDMGLDDISMLDLRELDPPASLGPNLIMLFGTTRSERHLHVSSGRFVRWLKRNYDIGARADGLIGPGELRTKLRRLRKKAKLLGTNTATIPGGDNGISTGWVCVNFECADGDTGEAASFDLSGRLSGFGAPHTGTTIVVQCMTETRRQELELESLWQGILRRSLQDNKRVRGDEPLTPQEIDEILASKVQLSKSASSLQWQAMRQASQQRRSFSTTSRRPSSTEKPQGQKEPPSSPSSLKRMAKSTPAVDEPEVPVPSFEEVSAMVLEIQVTGRSITVEALQSLIRDIFQAPDGDADKRLSLADELLHTADERGMAIWSNEMFVTLIEAMVYSPAYGPELERSQKNFEHLMISDGHQPDNRQVFRLMRAYAHHKDWEKFWDAFRMPPRFKGERDSSHYALAYRTMAGTGNQKMCIEALKWVYPEMISQKPPILAIGPLYEALKTCILVADPAADIILHSPVSTEGVRLTKSRRMSNREYLKVLREVEGTREQVESHMNRLSAAEPSI